MELELEDSTNTELVWEGVTAVVELIEPELEVDCDGAVLVVEDTISAGVLTAMESELEDSAEVV